MKKFMMGKFIIFNFAVIYFLRNFAAYKLQYVHGLIQCMTIEIPHNNIYLATPYIYTIYIYKPTLLFFVISTNLCRRANLSPIGF